MSHLPQGILILDYGSQYTLLIARRVRELGVYCEVWPCDDPRVQGAEVIQTQGVILSGGPSSIADVASPKLADGLLDWGVPVLGICYGMQAMADALGAAVGSVPTTREYGRTLITVEDNVGLFAGFSQGVSTTVWMSHGDSVTEVPHGWQRLAVTQNGTLAAMANLSKDLYGVQFHPEVVHSEEGTKMLSNFAISLCGCSGDWTVSDMLESATASIQAQVKEQGRVICGLSGGVDSSVTAALIQKAIPGRLDCVFVDNGLLRHNEVERVRAMFEGHFDLSLHVIDAADKFVDALAGITDPETKRKRIGALFIEVFEETAKGLPQAPSFLAQGTLYPDVIESVSVRGPAATIKSHHNVGGLPEKMGFALVEPLRELFKDEVRALGVRLGLPEHMVMRHPFPGPGLAIRIIGEVTHDRLDRLRAADHIFISMLHEHDLYDEVWQAFAVLLPIKSVGVMGDQRTYEDTIALRAVTSVDGMTADRAHLPMSFLGEVSDRIINNVTGINRVVYDISSKPPATIEWE